MGRSAKGYKKPTLKEKQQTRKTKSTLSQDGGLKDWPASTSSSTIRLAASAIQRGPGTSQAPSSRRGGPLARPADPKDEEEDDDQDEEGDDDEQADGEDAAADDARIAGGSSGPDKAKKKNRMRAKAKGSRGSGGGTESTGASNADEIRTPRDQGIDYLGLWAGKKQEIVSARIKQGRPVKGATPSNR